MLKTRVFLCLFLYTAVIFSQKEFTGKIINEKGEPLLGANIIASPITKDAKFSYTTTNEKGTYKLVLSNDANYNITVSFIGYITLKKQFFMSNEITAKTFTLKEDPNELEEVVITYKEPIKVTKDTTTYRVDAFTNGKERKLRQVLKKLPGVEVDRKGNVTVKGKKVTTVLVDNKTFFTGDTKLAVNNIPADVIENIQVIEDYHESSLLKGLEISEEVAMNISLKEDKKQFLFGDIEVGGGSTDRYVVHPTLFKYTPKVSYNFIGDFNNTNNKSFTLRDYMNYQGEFDLNTFSSVYNSPIIRLLNERENMNNKHLFGGFNVQYHPNEKNNWNAFVIGLKNKSNSLNELNQQYITQDIEENRTDFGEKNQQMLLGKIELKSKPNEDVRMKFDTKIEVLSAKNTNQVVSNTFQIQRDFVTIEDVDEYKVQTEFKTEKKFSSFHTSQLKVQLKASKNNDNIRWNSNSNIFSEALPITANTPYTVQRNFDEENYFVNLYFKYFWIVNPTNHLFFSVNNNIVKHRIDASTFQKTSSGNIFFNDFSGNINNNKIISEIAVEYKKLIGNAFLILKLKNRNYNRVLMQDNQRLSRSINQLIPDVKLEWELDRKRKFEVRYRLANVFPDTDNLFLINQLRSFNSIYRGNVNLTENNYHHLSLSFRKYQNYGWNFYPRISYRIRNKVIQSSFNQDGIYDFFTSFNSSTPNREFTTSLRTVYNYKYWKATLYGEYRNSNYTTFVNQNETTTNYNSVVGRANFRSVYIEGPNVDIALSQHYGFNKNTFFKSIIDRTKLDISLDYKRGNWSFKTDYNYSFFKNRISSSKNNYTNVNASIFYQKEDSPFGVELNGKNLIDNRISLTSSLSEVLFNETKTYLFPRTILLKIYYKL